MEIEKHIPQLKLASDATLRDYFAAAALQGLLARMPERDYASSVDAEDWSFTTGDAFRIADDMLNSRKEA